MDADRDIDKLVIDMPCPIPWDYMKGDHKIRYCDICQLNVHNLSAMTEVEIKGFLNANAGKDRVCVSMYRRPDGTIVTDRCPAGLRKLRDTGLGLLRIAAGFSALLLSAGAAWAQKPAESGSGKPSGGIVDSKTKAQWDDALAAFRANKLNDAIAKFNKLTANDPSRKSEYYKGLCLKGLKDYSSARISFERAFRESNDPEVKANSRKASAEMMVLIDQNSSSKVDGIRPTMPQPPIAGGICPPPRREAQPPGPKDIKSPAPNTPPSQSEKPD